MSLNQGSHVKSSRRRIVSLLIAVALVLGVVIAIRTWGPSREESDRIGERADDAHDEITLIPPDPLRTFSPFINTKPEVKYVGSEVCADCHDDIHQHFLATHHSRSLSTIDPHGLTHDVEFDHPLSECNYRIESDDSQIRHVESLINKDGSRTELESYPVKYQVGSGHVAKSFLIEDEGYLVQSPITWFRKDDRWGMSPGYNSADQIGFQRVISSGCLFCHAGQLEDAGHRGYRHQLKEIAIGCERCHGPGALHVKWRLNGVEAPGPQRIDRSIVNPRHLTREAGESICAQCHLQGSVDVGIRGRDLWDFRPGLPLQEYRLEFREESPASEIRVAGHVEQLHRSACYQKSETLTCTTCHDPHPEAPPSDPLAHQRQICLNCHEQQPCGVPHAERLSTNQDNCVACHMPQASTEVAHVALTNHRIGIHDGSSESDSDVHAADSGLISLQSLDFLPIADRERSLGLAQLKLVRIEGKSPEQLPRLERAAKLLRSAYDRGLRDPELLTALAGIARDHERIDIGIGLAAEALSSAEIPPEVRLEALDVLAELQFRKGELSEAAESLKQVVAGTRNAFHWFLLGQLERQLGHTASALEMLREAVRIDPRNAQYRRALTEMLDEAGLPDEAKQHRRLADQLEKN